jgi:Glycoside hydrolase 123, N-terminal domain
MRFCFIRSSEAIFMVLLALAAAAQADWMPLAADSFLKGAGETAGPNVPHVDVPFSPRKVVLDGQIGESEWVEAAIVRQLYDVGGKNPAAHRTTFFVKHDGEALSVAVQCEEDEPGYPRAFPRTAAGQLTDDDAVQVVLGVGSAGAAGSIEFGGYEGAQGQRLPPVAHYYQFTVNARGAIARTYNEAPLARPLFQAKASTAEPGWACEFRIPLASAGIEGAAGQTLHANFFRFRPPERTGWHLPGAGPYVPMPFGTMTLLKEGDGDKQSAESFPEEAPSEPSARTSSDDITFYPLSGLLVATVAEVEDNAGATAVLRVGGKESILSSLAVGRPNHIFLKIPTEKPTVQKAALEVRDAQGGITRSLSHTFESRDAPEWLGTDAGLEYVAERVPSPWRLPEIEGQTVELAHCTIAFGSSGLPESVVDEHGEMLTGPVVVELECQGKTMPFTPERLELQPHGHAVLITAEQRWGDASVQTRALLDYDGFMNVKVRVAGVEPAHITGLRVRVPLRRDVGRFVNRGNVQDTRKLEGAGYEGPGRDIWVGNEDKGMAFSHDTPLFLSHNKRSQAQVMEDGDATLMCFNLVDGSGQVEDEGHIFRFFLHPTPTKKNTLIKPEDRIDLWFENWSDYQGYPDLAKLPEARKRATAAHDTGKLLQLYFSMMLAENAPGFDLFRDDFMATPERMWYRRAYDPGKGVPCFVCCPRGPYGDLLLDGIERLVQEADIDGVYMDGTSYPWDCDNPSHPGCGEAPKVSWNTVTPTRIVGTRQFLKRLRGLFDARGKPFFMTAHTGGGLVINTLSFCDSFYEGEQLARYRPGYRLPLHSFAVGYSGWPWGVRANLLPSIYSVNGNASRMMTWGLLHDSEVLFSKQPFQDDIYRDFQDDALVTYYPYWRDQPHISLAKGDVLFSYYRKPDAAMLVVSNLNYEDQTVELDLGGLFDGPLCARDVARNRAVPLQGTHLTDTVEAHNWRAYRIAPANEAAPLLQKDPVDEAGPAATEVPQAFNLTRFDPAEWELTGTGSGIKLGDAGAEEASGFPVVITSTLYAEVASYRFAKHSFGPAGTVRLRLRHSHAFKVGVGDCHLVHGGQWSVTGTDPLDVTGRLHQVPLATERDVLLDMSWREGRLDILYDGKPFAERLKLASSTTGGFLTLGTWGGLPLAIDVVELSNEPTDLWRGRTKHPVR